MSQGPIREAIPASFDDAPLGSFHRRLTIFSCGGPFCDGYILGIVAVALAPLSRDIGLTPGWQGLIGAASLLGMFVGSSLFGYVTDLVGRQLMYTLDLSVFVLASGAQFWVHDPIALFALRFILGVAVGADYPIACALMTEFAPRRKRGMLLAWLVAAWWVGYAVSFMVGYTFLQSAHPPWRWMLASSALPAAAVLAMRFGTPESPRWLVAKGRLDEARDLVRRHLGAHYELDESSSGRTSYRRIFDREYLGRTLFVCTFWTCQIIPTFGIYTFAPALLKALGSPDPNLGTAIISLCFLAGVAPAIVLVERIGRRPLLTIPFAVAGIALGFLALLPRNSAGLISCAFIVFAMFNAGSSVLNWVYPSELFPTDVRATALGFATGVSRVGAALCTFWVPIGLHRFGITNVMLGFAAICGIGWVHSLIYAPETRGLSLAQASGQCRGPSWRVK